MTPAVAQVCADARINYQVSSPMATNGYTWTVTAGLILPENTTTVTGVGRSQVEVQWGTAGPGALSVQESTPGTVSCSGNTSLNVTIAPLPAPLVSGPASVCQNAMGRYTATSTPGNTLEWSVTGGQFSGGGTPLSGPGPVDVLWNGTAPHSLLLRELNPVTGCEHTVSYAVTVNPLALPQINGPASACAGDTLSYQLPSPNASHNYAWTVEGGRWLSGNNPLSGSGPVQVIWDGAAPHRLWVEETNALGCANRDTLAVNVTILPGPLLSGEDTLCAQQTESYQVTNPTAGNQYTWTVVGGQFSPSGSASLSGVDLTTVTIQWEAAGSGSLRVQEQSSGGGASCAATSQMDVFINPFPNSLIQGDSLTCENTTSIYQVSIAQANNNYTWTVSGGMIQPENTTSVSGIGRSQIDVQWGTAGPGLVALQESTPAGCSLEAPVKAVTVVGLPSSQITGPDTSCAGSVAVYQAVEPPVGAPYRYLYDWQVSGGSVISGQGTAQVSVRWDQAINDT
ncbi:MAG: hypothetical protein HC880_06710, partial [Bacteroidia bacterium]|nr:hypothetical protein [Bacteroidia bacterium]